MSDIDETEKRVKLLQSKSFIRMQLDLPEVLELTERVRQGEARIAKAAKLHRKYTYYELEDSCQDTSDEHREEHHHESEEIGEFYCDQMPTGDVTCDNCRDVNGDRMEWPCPTAVSLGLNEGENTDD